MLLEQAHVWDEYVPASTIRHTLPGFPLYVFPHSLAISPPHSLGLNPHWNVTILPYL